MHIIQVVNAVLPAIRYGGTERVVWSLARELVRAGHRVTLLALPGTVCDFARVAVRDSLRPLARQIAALGADIVHFHEGRGLFTPEEHAAMGVPAVTTVHGNVSGEVGENAIFLSRNHARRHGVQTYVYNGLDWDEYDAPDLGGYAARRYFHFLAKAAWRLKNVQGAIETVRGLPDGQLRVLGGTRLNLKMGFRLTLDLPPRVRFYGMVDQQQKCLHLRNSRGLLFPVKWHEPFGLAVTESLWFGGPAFCTPYGSLPELVIPEVGALSASASELRERMALWGDYSPRICHEYARDRFNSRLMAERYLDCYERVLNGETLNAGRSVATGTAERLPFYR